MFHAWPEVRLVDTDTAEGRPAQDARSVAVARRLERISPAYRAGYSRAADGSASPRAAIKSFCLECVCYIRKEITACTAVACPLWLYRPYQDAAEDEAGE